MSTTKRKMKSIDLTTLEHAEFFVAGLVHHANLAVLNLSPGDTLDLVPEPSNNFDPNAIAIYDGPAKLGFVPGPKNAQQTRVLEDLHYFAKTGYRFRCLVKNFVPSNPSHRMLLVSIYYLPPEPTVAHNKLASF